MSVESPTPNGEFYKPLATTSEVRQKIQDMLHQVPATISDVQLFEAIADTRATIATRLVATRKILGRKFAQLLTVDDLNDVAFGDGEKVTGVGYHEEGSQQIVYATLISEPACAFFFHRNLDGTIDVAFNDPNQEDEDSRYHFSPDSFQRRTIVEGLMRFLEQPVENID